MIPQEDIRNFSIIAHIDHGKSTLSDRLIELCGAVEAREMEPQLLDNMDLERERGITIKARAVGLTYHRGGKTYTLNLIDTPGHVDFNYEVSRSLAACEGAVLIVDASQGVEAQTLANTYLALEHDLEILPVINKIDLPAADPQRTKTEIEDIIGIPAMDAPEISAKQGINIQAVLDDIVDHVPAPKGDPNAPLQALVFDSQYDSYRGVIVLMRIVAGTLRRGMEVTMMSTGASYKVLEVGHLRPIGLDPCDELGCGDVGYFTASIKNVEDTRVGDTVTETARPAAEPLPGYRPARSMVYCGIYTEDGSKYPDLRDALEKLKLNDASLSFEPESSVALGFGFRCGFLGMLHMEIIQERLEREFDLDLITTLPSVIYRITKTDGTVLMIDNPHDYPNPASIEVAEEPFVNVSIITPQEFVGNIMPLCQDLRGEYKNMQYLDSRLVELHYEMPLNEIVYNFFDTLKARTKGYASLDYEFSSYHPSELVKVDMLLNGDQVDALSFIAHKDKAYGRARKLCEKLKENIPRQLFEVAEEPFVNVSIITPQEFVGNIMPLCQDLRGEYKNMQYLDSRLVELHYEMPLNEIVYNFFDTLKARTKGYASLDYEFSSYHPSELVKVDMLLNGDQVDALSFIAHKDKAYGRARKLCEKLKENIPRQLFEIPVQAAIGGKIIARETVKALRKDVLAKCYGGDITRKKKLLEKQKEGKKKMRQLGTVQIPTEAFLAVLKLDE